MLAWGVPRLRDLPWRATRDPWRILVAEVMLQQTQAERVIPKWLAFCDAYPTPAACAGGTARRRAAALAGPRLPAPGPQPARRGDGDRRAPRRRVPDDLDALLALPGIGPYTARAVLAFAFERDVAVVDTNIARVLARVGRRAADAAAGPGARRRARAGRRRLGVEPDADGPRRDGVPTGAALCDECPLAPTCAWHRRRPPEPDPADGSAGVSTRQAPYDGSDRQARPCCGRCTTAPAAAAFPPIVDGLVADRLVVRTGDGCACPDAPIVRSGTSARRRRRPRRRRRTRR